MSELLIFLPLLVVGCAVSFLAGMGVQVWSEMRWIKSSRPKTQGTDGTQGTNDLSGPELI
jgi:hypothetical protein